MVQFPLRTIALPLALVAVMHAAAAQEPTPMPPPPPPPVQTPDFVKVAKKILPSIVAIRTFVRVEGQPAEVSGPATEPKYEGEHSWLLASKAERDYDGFRPFGAGSGFFVGASGEILTHLAPIRVTDEKLVDIVEVETMDGQKVLAEVVGIEPTLQLAVLRCVVFSSWTRPAMQPVTFGDSDAVEVGSWALAIGDPQGPERFLGIGLVSAKPSRDCYQELMSATYMQATITVPIGVLGGALVDLDGNVLGMLTKVDAAVAANFTTSGSAWALPSKIVSGLYAAIRTAGTTQSPWLGFSVMSRAEIVDKRGFQAFQAMTKPPHGILLENVFSPSPAATVGLKPGDFLTHFGGAEIHAPVEFQRHLYLAGVGRKVELTFFRDGATFKATLAIEKRPPEAKPR